MNPHEWREATLKIDLPALGLDWGDSFGVQDLLSGEEYRWSEYNYIRLDPHLRPAHVLAVRPDPW
jgi:starch synthase (maltosyl-transferring)